MKNHNRALAESLRRQGHLYSEIAIKLGISKSTAYAWTHAMALTSDEQKRINLNSQAARTVAIASMNQAKLVRHNALQTALSQQAKQIIEGINLDINTKRALCAVMFWCEGEKNVSSGVKFINSDPVMMRTFLALFREGFEVQESKFRALLHVHEYHDVSKQLAFWSEVTAIPQTQFHKTYIKPHTGKNIHEGYQGCLSLRYGDAQLGKLLKMIYSELGRIT